MKVANDPRAMMGSPRARKSRQGKTRVKLLDRGR